MNVRDDLPASAPAFDVMRWRADFPALHQSVHGRPLVYLDNAATSQKPQALIDCLARYYSTQNANVHRGIHALSQRATDAFEAARETVRAFINAPAARDIVFVRGCTEAINLVAHSYGRSRLKAGDEIVLSEMEHHSNIVPWQLLCEQIGAVLRVAPINDAGELMLDRFEQCLGPRTRLVAIAHVSNALGSVNPLRAIIDLAHAAGAVVLVDGAQAAPHLAVDVRQLDCDFYAFSGHKLYGPTGIGVLYGKTALLEAMPPYQGGGDMISRVRFERSTYNAPPYRFEAGTPDIAGAIGLAAALDYVNGIGRAAIAAHEHALLDYATGLAGAVPGLRLIGQAREKAAILSFVIEGLHPHDIGTVLDYEGVAIRSGHSCAMPLMEHFGIAATARASFALYNTRAEVDALFAAIDKARQLFGAAQQREAGHE